jgi:hypothetical protein
MNKLTRRSFLKPRLGLPNGIAVADGVPDEPITSGTTRSGFLKGTAGAAAGAAVILATPKVAAIALDTTGSSVPVEPKGVPTTPVGPAPYEPVTAYVRNADRGEVTVMSGKHETTYNDPVLVKRLLDVAH